MHALAHSTITLILCGEFVEAGALTQELIALAEDKGSMYWRANGKMWAGCIAVLTGHSCQGAQTLTSALHAYRSTGATIYTPFVLSLLARAYAGLGRHKETWRAIEDAMTAIVETKEKWCEADIHRIAGEITLMTTEPEEKKAEGYFERALAVARVQQAKSWELRAAMSMAHLWRDQGKRQQAHDLLGPVYGWFTEGFDSVDLKEAKALLEQLKA